MYNSHNCAVYIFPDNSFFGGYGKKNRRNKSVWFSDLSINHISLSSSLSHYFVKYAYSHTSSIPALPQGIQLFRIKSRIFKNCYLSFIYFTRIVHGAEKYKWILKQKSIFKSMLSHALFRPTKFVCSIASAYTALNENRQSC